MRVVSSAVTIVARESAGSPAAEGATAPETLRHQGPRTIKTSWKAAPRLKRCARRRSKLWAQAGVNLSGPTDSWGAALIWDER